MHAKSIRSKMGKGHSAAPLMEKEGLADAAEVRRLIAAARRRGTSDDYTGKRDGARFAVKMPLEASTSPADSSAAWAVQLHNISESGFSFWSKQQVAPRSSIYIREFSANRTHPWVPGKVTHCTVGIRGCLVGCRIDREALRK